MNFRKMIRQTMARLGVDEARLFCLPTQSQEAGEMCADKDRRLS